MKFTHLHVHSHYSILDGMSKVPDLVDKCLRTGMNSIALTDHGNMYGIKELLDYCKKINKKNKEAWAEKHPDEPFVPFKPIVGVEAYCARRGRLMKDKDHKSVSGEGRQFVTDMSGWHLILLAKNKAGYHTLCKLVSEGFMDDAFYRTPRIDKELLEQVGFKDVLCINPPDMTLETAMRPEVARRNVFETVKEYLSTLP